MSAGAVLLMLFGLFVMGCAFDIEPGSKGAGLAFFVVLALGAAIVWWAGWGPSLHFEWSVKPMGVRPLT